MPAFAESFGQTEQKHAPPALQATTHNAGPLAAISEIIK